MCSHGCLSYSRVATIIIGLPDFADLLYLDRDVLQLSVFYAVAGSPSPASAALVCVSLSSCGPSYCFIVCCCVPLIARPFGLAANSQWSQKFLLPF